MMNIENLKDVNEVYLLAQETSNNFLRRESAKEILTLISKMSNKQLQDFKKTDDFKQIPNGLLDFLKRAYIVNEDQVASFILHKVSSESVFNEEVPLQVYSRKSLKENVLKLVNLALSIKKENIENINDYMPYDMRNISFSSLEKSLQDSFQDLLENAGVYNKNPRFNKESVVELILKENPSLEHSYKAVKIGEKYIISTSDKNYLNNFKINL